MTTIQLNAALFRELNIIMTDETMMEKAIKALRRITLNRHQKTAVISTTDKELPELPESIKRLRGIVSFTPEEVAQDDRLAYLLNK